MRIALLCDLQHADHAGSTVNFQLDVANNTMASSTICVAGPYVPQDR